MFSAAEPRFIHGNFSENANIFCNLHPNKSVLEDTNPRAHSHDFIELSYVRKGHFHQQIDERVLHLPEGSVILHNCHTPHNPWVNSSDDIVANYGTKAYTVRQLLSSIGAKGDKLSGIIFDKPEDLRAPFLVAHNKDVNALLSDMFCEFFEQRDMLEPLLLADLLRIMIELSRDEQPENEPFISMDDSSLLTAIQTYIEDNYTRLDMDTLCRHFHFSERHMRGLRADPL
jgi:hypothetical protein